MKVDMKHHDVKVRRWTAQLERARHRTRRLFQGTKSGPADATDAATVITHDHALSPTRINAQDPVHLISPLLFHLPSP